MVVSVVPVVAGFEERSELDRLIGFVVMHRAEVEAGHAKGRPGPHRNDEQAAEDGPVHLAGVPNTSTST